MASFAIASLPKPIIVCREMPNWDYERAAQEKGFRCVAGIDEAGRGPLAGPVSAAAVVLPQGFFLEGLDDSKKLSEKARERLFAELMDIPGLRWGQSFGDPAEIDEMNILRANDAAMARAAAQIAGVDYALIDGRPVKNFPLPSQGIVKGDRKSLSIAAASIIAKVARDRLMVQYDERYPEYGFAKHKGYGTKAHLTALKKYGPCPIHRRSFAPVAEAARLFGAG